MDNDLKNQLTTDDHGRKIEEILSNASLEITRGHLDKAREILNEADSFAETDAERARCKSARAHFLMSLDQNREALPILLELIENLENGLSGISVAQLYNQIGICYRDMGDFDKCLSYYRKAYEAFCENEDLHGMAGTIINISNVYRSHGKYDVALEHYRQAEEIIGDRDGFDEHRALLLKGMGAVYRKRKDIDKAMICLQEAIEICYKREDTRGVCNALNSMALLRKDQNRYDDALELYNSSLELARAKGYDALIATLLSNIGQLYMLKDQYEEAKEPLAQGLEIAQRIHARQIVMQNYFMHARLAAGLGDIQKIVDYFLLYDEEKGALLNDRAVERMSNLEMKFDLERKEHEAEVYRLRNEELVEKNRQLKEAQDEILQLERRNSIYAMAVTANHELNQPLMVIQGNLDMLETYIQDGGDKAKQRLEKIRSALCRINDLLKKFRQLEDAHLGEYSSDTPMVVFDSDFCES